MQLKDFDFRVWNKDEETLTYASKDYKLDIGFSNPQQDYGVCESELHAYYDGEPMCPSDCEIELWSGFYDCKGKKIYENDIIQTTEEIGVVEYNRGTFWVRQENIEPYRLNVAIFEEFMNYGKVEVIGNIHENAEFLGKDKEC